MSATIRETLTETEMDALQQFDAESGNYVPNTVRHPTAQPIERDADGNRTTVEWTTRELDMIAMGVQGRQNWTDHDTYAFRRDLLRQLKSLISFADFDEDLDFVTYETAASLCMMAYSNGKRTAKKHAEAVDSLAQARRQSSDAEWDDAKIQLLVKREAGFADRLWWWREYYAAARQAYRETVRDLGPNFQQWCDAEWTPPDVKAAQAKRAAQRRNDTAARAELNKRVSEARNREKQVAEQREREAAYRD